MANPEHVAKLKKGVSAWNKWRVSVPKVKNLRSKDSLNELGLLQPVLMAADLRGVDLTGADLYGADLRKVDLRDAILHGADISGADLTGANLRGANLKGAIMIQTQLVDADLTEATLNVVNLIGANVKGADFTRAILGLAVIARLDLSNVRGLENVRHSGPSSIGVDTLYKSGGNIPEVFLRGCGVPDTMIAYAKSLVSKAIDFYSCFISYSSADEAFAKMLYDTLQGAGIRCWFAPDQILPGERIDSAIDHGIRYSDKVVFCASKSSLTEKWWVDFEVDKAFKKARDLQRERGEKVDVIIPLNLDDYLFSPEYDLDPKRSIFEMTNAADFVGWKNDLDKYNREVQKLIRALRTDGGKEDPPESKL